MQVRACLLLCKSPGRHLNAPWGPHSLADRLRIWQRSGTLPTPWQHEQTSWDKRDVNSCVRSRRRLVRAMWLRVATAWRLRGHAGSEGTVRGVVWGIGLVPAPVTPPWIGLARLGLDPTIGLHTGGRPGRRVEGSEYVPLTHAAELAARTSFVSLKGTVAQLR